MCFSATTTDKTKRILEKVLDDHAVISTLKLKEHFTLAGVEQSSIIIPSIKHTFQALYSLIDLETSKSEDYPKIIILGNTPTMVALYARLFQERTRVKVYEVHSYVRRWD